MRREPTDRKRSVGGAVGFTLIELLIVMVIIGILLALILSAAMAGIRQAEERATQALITKLDAGMLDRVEAIINEQAEVRPAHELVAALWNSSLTFNPDVYNFPVVTQRSLSQTIAQLERMKSELPDVFVVQPGATIQYPLNFQAIPYTAGRVAGKITSTAAEPYEQYLLPMGAGVVLDSTVGSYSYGSYTDATLASNPVSTGIYGASYSVRAGFMKQLNAAAVAYLQKNDAAFAGPSNPPNSGFDGADNNGNGLVDELIENDIGQPGTGTRISAAIRLLLANHKHKTARAACLYAILVEGQGPLGSVFSRDDFRDREVRDTDGDGLLEFVDSWGEPVQFYRWPIGYESDVQKGLLPYSYFSVGGGGFASTEPRAQNPLDANQNLVNPAWWSNSFNSMTPIVGPLGTPTTPAMSANAAFFHQSFFSLVDPNANASLSPVGASVWSRGDARRAYYSRFLVLSGGPNKLPGVPVLDASYFSDLGVARPGTQAVQLDLLVESQAAPYTPDRSDAWYMTPLSALSSAPNYAAEVALSAAIREAGTDDLSSHNLQGPGGATQ